MTVLDVLNFLSRLGVKIAIIIAIPVVIMILVIVITYGLDDATAMCDMNAKRRQKQKNSKKLNAFRRNINKFLDEEKDSIAAYDKKTRDIIKQCNALFKFDNQSRFVRVVRKNVTQDTPEHIFTVNCSPEVSAKAKTEPFAAICDTFNIPISDTSICRFTNMRNAVIERRAIAVKLGKKIKKIERYGSYTVPDIMRDLNLTAPYPVIFFESSEESIEIKLDEDCLQAFIQFITTNKNFKTVNFASMKAGMLINDVLNEQSALSSIFFKNKT